MKIVLKYDNGSDVVVDYNPNVASIATRHPETDERFIHAVCPEELKEDVQYLYRLRASCKPGVDADSQVSFI